MRVPLRLKLPVRTIVNLGFILKEAALAWNTHNATRMAAALAFYTIFSLTPALLIALSVATAFVGRAAAWQELSGALEQQFGSEVAAFVLSTLDTHIRSDGTFAPIIGIAVMLFGATAVFSEFKSGLNEIWGVTPPKEGRILRLVYTRVLSFSAVLSIGCLLIASALVSTVISTVSAYVAKYLPITAYVLQGINFAVALSLMTLLFATLYKILPDVPLSWRDVWVGALITAALFMIGKFLIGIYLTTWFSSSVYGAAGSLVILLAWVYYSSMVALFGAELTRVHASLRHPETMAVVMDKE